MVSVFIYYEIGLRFKEFGIVVIHLLQNMRNDDILKRVDLEEICICNIAL